MKNAITRGLTRVEQRVDSVRQRLTERIGRDDPLRVLPFRGFGTGRWLWLKGRVLEAEVFAGVGKTSVVDRLRAMLRRYESDEVAGAKLVARLGDREWELETDEEGYFELELTLDSVAEELVAPWTDVSLCLAEPRTGPHDEAIVRGLVRVPGDEARLGIISDMDDTVVKTGATELLRHVRTVLLNDAHTREPFAGVSAFYRALHRGAAGDEDNPFFYVSSSPWNLFDLFEAFLDLHDIPLGPILLKDFGVDEGKLLKSGHVDYKAERIGRILRTYPELPFVLLGDSGQKDAWVFDEVVQEHPGRICAAFLRDLSPDHPNRELDEIERRLAEQGVPMRRVADTAEAAVLAHERGWISSAQLDSVQRDVAASG